MDCENITEVVLILEDETDKHYHHFNSTYGLEEFLKTINLNDYEYTNILFRMNGELDYKLCKLYKDRYIKKLI